MPKKIFRKKDTREEEGLREMGKRGAARHPGLKDAQDLLDDQAPPRNMPATKNKATGKGVGPDTTF